MSLLAPAHQHRCLSPPAMSLFVLRLLRLTRTCMYLMKPWKGGSFGHNSAEGSACLQNDILFGLPVVLDTDSEDYAVGDQVLLQYQGQDLAVFTVESKWVPNKPLEAKHCYGTTSIEHPAVQMISMERGKYYMGERLLRRASRA